MISGEEHSPAHYDPAVFASRYQNGQDADMIDGFHEIRQRLQETLRERPLTSEELSEKLRIDYSTLQRILDHLYTHTAEIATVDMVGKRTCYIWADTKVLREVIEKTESLLDKEKMLDKLEHRPNVEIRVELLRKKLHQLKKRLDEETTRWGSPEEETSPSKGAVARESRHEEVKPAQVQNRYPFRVVHLIGESYRYSGPDREKRIEAHSNKLSLLDFGSVARLVVELDTFSKDLEQGKDIVEVVDLYLRTAFTNEKIDVVMRKIPKIEYRPKIARRLHREVL